MNKISKPHIVDFLRLADQNKWFSPRIRYASVRSKPELIADLRYRFLDHLEKGLIHFDSLHPNACLPEIAYCLDRRKFLLDGLPVNVPKVSRSPGCNARFWISATDTSFAFHRASFCRFVRVY